MFSLIKKVNTLFNLIASIEEKDNVIHIKTKKDLVIENSGHCVVINKGYSINIAKEIHFNPELNLEKNLNNIEEVTQHKRKQIENSNI